MKYLIIGTGGTGGPLGAYLKRAGHDTAFIARGEHLAAMKEKGLTILHPDGAFTIDPVKAFTMEEYNEGAEQYTNVSSVETTVNGHNAVVVYSDFPEDGKSFAEYFIEYPNDECTYICVEAASENLSSVEQYVQSFTL